MPKMKICIKFGLLKLLFPFRYIGLASEREIEKEKQKMLIVDGIELKKKSDTILEDKRK